jgi:predicted dehydrogenase
MAALRVGIIGANPGEGGAATIVGAAPGEHLGQSWGAIAHVPALRSLPDFEITAICGSRPETAAAAARAFGVARAHHDYRALAQDPDVDIVAVAVKIPMHLPLVMAALEAGKHVYCEAPLACDLAQAEALAARARDSGVCAMLGFQFRADPAFRHLQDMLADGRVGEVRSVDLTMSSGGARAERAPAYLWSRDRRLGGGVTTIRAMHSLDGLCAALGEFVQVTARVETRIKLWRNAATGEALEADAPDHIFLAGVLQSGAVVSATITHVPYDPAGYRMEIHGDRGTIVITSKITPQWSGCEIRASRDGAPLAPVAIPQRLREAPPATPDGPPLNVAHLYMRLGRAIREGHAAEPGFEVGVARHRLMEAVMQSSALGRPVTLG